MEYYNLRLEDRTDYENSYYSTSLIMMISDYYKIEYNESTKIVRNSIRQTKTPIELLKMIQRSIQ